MLFLWATLLKFWFQTDCSGWVPCFVCFPAFRGHVTLFFSLLFDTFQRVFAAWAFTRSNDQNWSVSTHWRLYCLEHCLRVLSRFKIVAVLAVLEIKVRKQEWISSLHWPRTRKFSQLLQAGKAVAFDFSRHGHALVTFYVQFWCSDWSKFDRWVHAENLCSIWKLVYW